MTTVGLRMTMARRSAMVGGTLLVVAAACGGKETGAGDACGAFFDTLAAMWQQCGAPQVLDPATRAPFVDWCNAVESARGAGDVASEYEACAKNLDVRVCRGPQCTPYGTLAAGAACTDGAQCKSGSCAPAPQAVQPNPNSEQVCGTCVAVAEKGESCASIPCDPFALLICSGGTCAALVPQGGACTGAECEATTTCDGQTHTCQPLPDQGQPCTSECMPKYACVGGTCGARVTAGGACPLGNECAFELSCDTQSHTCVSGSQPGQPCGTSSTAPQCAYGSQCIQGTCLKVDKLEGDACLVGAFECESHLVCANGTCQLPDFTLCK